MNLGGIVFIRDNRKFANHAFYHLPRNGVTLENISFNHQSSVKLYTNKK